MAGEFFSFVSSSTSFLSYFADADNTTGCSVLTRCVQCRWGRDGHGRDGRSDQSSATIARMKEHCIVCFNADLQCCIPRDVCGSEPLYIAG